MISIRTYQKITYIYNFMVVIYHRKDFLRLATLFFKTNVALISA